MTTNRLDLLQFELSYRSGISSCLRATGAIVLFDELWGDRQVVDLSRAAG